VCPRAPLNLPRIFLGASKRYDELSVPVTRVELDHAVSAGVELKTLGADMVPLFEEHEARLLAGYRLEAWGSMDVMERALVVAQRRIRIAVENLQSEAQIKHAKANAKRK